MTAQLADRIMMDGNSYPLYSSPLEGWLKALPERPAFLAQSSANWRGYQAEWQVLDDELYLTDVVGQICTRTPDDGAPPRSGCRIAHHGACCPRRISLVDLFPDGAPVPADWVNDELLMPAGPMIQYVHHGHASTHARYLLISVKGGRVMDMRHVDQRPPRPRSQPGFWQRCKSWLTRHHR